MNFIKQHSDIKKDDQKILSQWHEYLKNKGEDDLEWLNDKQLLKSFIDDHETGGTLIKAVKCRVW